MYKSILYYTSFARLSTLQSETNWSFVARSEEPVSCAPEFASSLPWCVFPIVLQLLLLQTARVSRPQLCFFCWKVLPIQTLARGPAESRLRVPTGLHHFPHRRSTELPSESWPCSREMPVTLSQPGCWGMPSRGGHLSSLQGSAP